MAKPPVSAAIDVRHTFPALAHAPVVETVVEWRAEPTVTVKIDEMRPRLEQLFKGYSIQPLRHLQTTIAASEHGVGVAEAVEQSGYRVVSADGHVVGQILPNGVAVSRLEPYAGWEEFLPRARPFLTAFVMAAQPTTYSRLGVRSISKIPLAVGKGVATFMKGVGRPWSDFGLESTSFFHQDAVRWPGTAYGVRLVRAMDPSEAGDLGVLFLDIDISLEETIPLDEADQRLEEMRFLKNRVFFSTVRNAEAHFGERR
ncbi:MAG: TIGR04255 family protein [Planctomycetes bacterium]|nr:TIGR04255 family protein [Planctomycetota bacterium]